MVTLVVCTTTASTSTSTVFSFVCCGAVELTATFLNSVYFPLAGFARSLVVLLLPLPCYCLGTFAVATSRYHPGYFGKVGMRYFHKTTQQFYKPTINLDKVWSLVTEQHYNAEHKDGKLPVIDAVKAVCEHCWSVLRVGNLTHFFAFCFCSCYDCRVTSRSSPRVESSPSPPLSRPSTSASRLRRRSRPSVALLSSLRKQRVNHTSRI